MASYLLMSSMMLSLIYFTFSAALSFKNDGINLKNIPNLGMFIGISAIITVTLIFFVFHFAYNSYFKDSFK